VGGGRLTSVSPDSPFEVARLRPIPHPYRAMLAICSDLDETPDAHVYFETARYLSSTGETTMGPGLGLEVGNTIYFDMPPSQFAYWNTDDRGRETVRTLIRSGHVDCYHSFGDLALTRRDAARSLDDLDRHGCRLAVWIDHAVAPTNFGADIMQGSGDVPGAPAYHADLTVGHGVRFVWRGRVTSVTGQDVPRRLGTIFDPRHPLASGRTLAKEAAKGVVGSLGVEKYAMHAPNRMLRAAKLRDGQPILEFLRANPCWRAVDRGETADGLAEVLTPTVLDRLAQRGGLMILYTHLGKVRNPREPLSPATRAALGRLAEAHRNGRVLVTTTRRLLEYVRDRDEATWQCRWRDHVLEIDVRTPGDGSGLCFAVRDPERARFVVNGKPCETSRTATDADGTRYLCLPWPRLEFPRL
jgi:hypothetical protein